MDTNIITLNVIRHYLSWIILKYIWKGKMWHKLVYEKLRLTQLWMVRNYSVFLAENESYKKGIYQLYRQTNKLSTCYVLYRCAELSLVCCLLLYHQWKHSHEKFYQSFHLETKQEKATEMYFDKWVIQVNTTAYSELQNLQIASFSLE